MNGAGELVRVHVDRDAPLLHALQQAGLRLRRRAVDLVDEHDVGEDRPGPELEALVALVEDVRADDVGGQQVGGALHARELAGPARARAPRASVVLPTPGRSSIRTWPSASSATMTSATTSSRTSTASRDGGGDAAAERRAAAASRESTPRPAPSPSRAHGASRRGGAQAPTISRIAARDVGLRRARDVALGRSR